MRPQEASRVKEIQLSAIRVAAQLAEDLAKQGQKVIDLSRGQPDFDTPLHIKEAAKRALDAGKVHYVNNFGIIELRQALARKVSRENGFAVKPEEIMVTVGAVEALAVALMAFVDPGDEVLIVEPSWVNYPSIVRLCGGVPVYVSLAANDGFSLLPERVRQKISSRTKAVMYTSPNNPTGTVLPLPVLKELAEISKAQNLMVLADEVYEKIVYDGFQHISMAALPGMRERTITVNAFSKTYSMTGWRLGYLAADQSLMPSLIRVHQNLVTSANSIAQWAALEAVTGPQQCVTEMVAEFTRRRNFLIQAFADLSPLRLTLPEGAFYGFVDVRGLNMTSMEAVEFFIKKARVAVVAGDAFGPSGSGYIRFSFASSMANLEEAVEKMRQALHARG